MAFRLRTVAVVFFSSLLWFAGACGPNGEGPDTGTPSGDTGLETMGGDTGDADGGPSTEAYPLRQCDSLEPFRCALPWPSNLYLAPDDDRPTGYQLRFGEKSLPATRNGDHIDPDPFRHLDGYGLGTPIMAHFPNVDTSGMASRFDIAPSVEPEAPIVLLEVGADGSTSRVPYWAELDARADEADEQLLIVRPAEILEENTRYVVAFRNLRTDRGARVEAPEAFRRLRDRTVRPGTTLAERRGRFEEVFEILERAGVARESLTLAWDFRTASAEGLRGRLKTMRETAVDEVGPKGPTLDFTADDVESYDKPGAGEGPTDPNIALEIAGSFDAPHFMKEVSDDRSWIFNKGPDGAIRQNGVREAKFLMRVPHSATEGGPTGVILFGHGLLGSRASVRADIWGELADEYNYVVVAADWTGMAKGDRDTAIASATNVSDFQGIAERMHQGILEFLLLARSAKHRAPELEALTSRGVNIDDSQIYYAGASQGGIYGQTFMAMTETISRGFLAVPGNNYSTLLKRSVNFDPFLTAMRTGYETAATRTMCIGAMQLMWSGTDPVSYATHIENDPVVEGPSDKDVLLAPSKGDYQVAVVTNEVLARSDSGIPIMEPYDEDHDPWNVATATYPHDESGIVLFDYGNPWPKGRRNLPPREIGDDPHDNLGQVDEAGRLIDTFFRDEKIVDICDPGSCEF